jgi:acetyl esterase/lipase
MKLALYFVTRFILIYLAFVNLTPLFSQDQLYEKKVFVYKKVNNHEIEANIFIPNIKQQHPVVVYFHGGGFIFGNRDQGLEDVLRDKLLAHHYAVVSADYRLAPETKLDEILKDVSDVIKWFQKNVAKQFQIDPTKIAVLGGSAGGYLALSTGYNVQPPPQAIIAISTPTDFSKTSIQKGDETILKQPGPYDVVSDTIVSHGDYDARLTLWRFLAKHRLILSEVFGFDVSQDTIRLQNFMLTKNITANYPPTLLIHAKNDRLVDLPQVEQFEAFLKGVGVDSELYLVEEGHSTQLIRDNPEAVEKIVSFLDKYLR